MREGWDCWRNALAQRADAAAAPLLRPLSALRLGRHVQAARSSADSLLERRLTPGCIVEQHLLGRHAPVVAHVAGHTHLQGGQMVQGARIKSWRERSRQPAATGAPERAPGCSAAHLSRTAHRQKLLHHGQQRLVGRGLPGRAWLRRRALWRCSRPSAWPLHCGIALCVVWGAVAALQGPAQECRRALCSGTDCRSSRGRGSMRPVGSETGERRLGTRTAATLHQVARRPRCPRRAGAGPPPPPGHGTARRQSRECSTRHHAVCVIVVPGWSTSELVFELELVRHTEALDHSGTPPCADVHQPSVVSAFQYHSPSS